MTLSACNSQYERAIQSNDKDVMLETANALYEKKKWSDALSIYEKMTSLVAGTPDAAEVVYRSANANFYDKNYKLSGHQFKNFAVTFPQDSRAEEALYMSALSYYKDSQAYNLDQSYTQTALSELQDFMNKYPTSERSSNIQQLIDELNYKLEFKAYENARQYYRMNEYKAAIVSFENVLSDFPGTKLRSKIEEMMLRSREYLAINSVYELKKERLESAIAATRTLELKNPALVEMARESRARLEKEQESFMKIYNDFEAKKIAAEEAARSISTQEEGRVKPSSPDATVSGKPQGIFRIQPSASAQ